MKRFIAMAVAACSLAAMAEDARVTDKEARAVALLDSLFYATASAPGAETRAVKFTGSDFGKAGGGFWWQRGNGRGWTAGKRVTLKDAPASEGTKFDDIFKRVAAENFTLRYNDNTSATLIESTGTVYIYGYDPEKSALSFMRASTTGEICVPRVWATVDSIDATPYDPLAFASREERAQLGLARLWAGVRRNFAFMDRVKVNWDSLYVATMRPVAEAAAAGDDERVGELLQLMVAHLGDGHTYVWGYGRSKSYTPVATVLIDGHVYVDSVASPELAAQGIERGMELVSVNGEPVLDYGRRRIMPFISSSTPQWSDGQTFDGYALLSAHAGDTLRLELRKGRKAVEAEYVAGSTRFWGQPDSRAISFSRLPGNIGLLRVANFMDGDFREQFDSIYPSLLATDGLVIDLRGNGGGNSGNGDYILRHLATADIPLSTWESPSYIPAYASWGRNQPAHRSEGGVMKPFGDRRIYDRPAVVLVDRGTFSAAEDFTVIFRAMGRGKIIGTPTGGSTGNGVRLTLIDGVAYANICSKHDTAPDGTDWVGTGIIPDIEARETYETHFGRHGSAALKAALAALRGK